MRGNAASTLLCAAILLHAVGGCSTGGVPGNADDADTSFDQRKWMFTTINDADEVRLYEGLPHQVAESDLLQQELRLKETVTIQGFPFYRETLEPQEKHRTDLKEVLGHEGWFKPFSAGKKCRAFHPDYCVEWSAGGKQYRCLVCFGCREVKLYGPSVGLHCDINRGPFWELHRILTQYGKNRPRDRNPGEMLKDGQE